MKQNTQIITSVIVLVLLVSGIEYLVYKFGKSVRRDYQIDVYMNTYYLYDGPVLIGTFEYGDNNKLDSLVDQDNQ